MLRQRATRLRGRRSTLLFERESRNVVLRVFKGRHDVIYNADLQWLCGQADPAAHDSRKARFCAVRLRFCSLS